MFNRLLFRFIQLQQGITLLAIVLCLSYQASAQPQLLKGRILDINHQPVTGVNILLLGRQTVGTSTDQQGVFSLECQIGDTIHCSHVGYEPKTILLRKEAFAVNGIQLTILMEKQSINLQTVEISGKRDHIFRYLLDFEVSEGSIYRLEIRGQGKHLIRTNWDGTPDWDCMLPQSMNDCNILTRDFLGQVCLCSRDSVYELKASIHECNIRAAVSKSRYDQIMSPCIAMTSMGILQQQNGDYNKTLSFWVIQKGMRNLIYQQSDNLGLQYCRDLEGKSQGHAGLGFEVSRPGYEINSLSSLDRHVKLKGPDPRLTLKLMEMPLNVQVCYSNDSIFIFDHMIGLFQVMKPSGEVLLSCHLPDYSKEFQKTCIRDDISNKVYALYRNKKRGMYLRGLNLSNGAPGLSIQEMQQSFPDKVRIYDSHLVYIHRNPVLNNRILIVEHVNL